MTRKINQALWDTWGQRIERRHQCGGTIAAFCRSEGVSEASYHYWQMKLRQATAVLNSPAPKEPMAVAECVRRSKRASSNGGRSQGVADGKTNFLQLPVMAAPSSPWIELTLADGTLVRVPQQNTTALVSVLRILRGESLDRLDTEIRHA
jgi:hypothetical protein